MVHAVLLGAGKSVRLGFEIPKQLVKIAGKTVFEHTVEVFEDCDVVDRIVLVVSQEIRHVVEELVVKNDYKKVSSIVLGGETRRESSRIGVESLEAMDDDVVLIHDVARPFVDCDVIRRNVIEAVKHGAVDTVVESPDTIVEVDDEGFIKGIPKRSSLRRGQTPQTFLYSIIKRAHDMAMRDPEVDRYVTDDCGLVLRYGLSRVKIVDGSEYNIKITYPLDVYLADKIFQLKRARVLPSSKDMEALKDKVLVVFGGTSGIGKELCEIADSYGAKVFAFSRRVGIDVRDPESVSKALREVHEDLGRIDYVVNTAGILKMGKIVNRDLEGILEEVGTNYLGAINVVRESIPYLRETRGMLVLISSSSYTRGRGLYSVYSSTKSAVVNLVQSVADEEPLVRINVVIPERTATPMRFKNFGHEPEETLLNPKAVALVISALLNRDLTGGVVEVRKLDEETIMKSVKA